MIVQQNLRSIYQVLIKSAKMRKNCGNFGLTYKQQYSFMSPVDKPIYSLSLTSLHQLSAAMQEYLTVQHLISPQLSVIGGAIAFRVSIQLVGIILRNFKFKNINSYTVQNQDVVESRVSGDENRLSLKIIDKVFVLDMVRDLQFYGVIPQHINKAAWDYYRPSVLLANLAIAYLNLNFLRGSHLIVTSPEFSTFCSSTLYLPNLALHDPSFVTPIIIILVNFYLLKKSRHPLLIHINHPGNFFYCFNFAFMSGLFFVPIPSIYQFAYLGSALGHIGIRGTKYFWQDLMRNFQKFTKI